MYNLPILLNCIYLIICILFSTAVEKVKSQFTKNLTFQEDYLEENFESFYTHLTEKANKIASEPLGFLSDKEAQQSKSPFSSFFDSNIVDDLFYSVSKSEIKELVYNLKIILSKFDIFMPAFSDHKDEGSINFNKKNLKPEKQASESDKNTYRPVTFSDFPEPIPGNHTDSVICKACLWSFTKFHQFLHKKYGLTLLNEVLALLCASTVEYSVCRKAIYLYSPQVYDSILEHYLDAEFICTKTHLCKVAHYIELNVDDYAKKVLEDKPQNKPAIPNEKAPKLKFLHVTDIHTDLLYKEVKF